MGILNKRAIVASLVVLVACSGGDGPPVRSERPDMTTPAQDQAELRARIVRAVAATFDQPSAVVEGSGEVGGLLDYRAVVDLTRPRARLSMKPEFRGVAAYAVSGKRLWFKALPHFYGVRGPPRWVSTTYEAIKGFEFGVFYSAAAENPAVHLQMLSGIQGVEELGSEEVNGGETTHYAGSLDLRLVADKTHGPFHDAVWASAVRMIRLGVNKPDVDVWIDESGRIRRLEEFIFYSSSANRSLRGTTTHYIFDWLDFAGRSAIEIPPPGAIPLDDFLRLPRL